MYLIDQDVANKIALQPMKYLEMQNLFQSTEAEADQWEMESRKVVEKQADNQVARAVVIYSPLYLENKAITNYCQQHPQLRNQLPEILTAEEMALIAQKDILLSEEQVNQVIKLTLDYQKRLNSVQPER